MVVKMGINFDLPDVSGEYRFNYNLGKTSWFRVGGNADVLFKPKDNADLQHFLRNIDPAVRIVILGNCSNVIIKDDGVRGVVIKLGKEFSRVENIGDGKYFVGCGVLNSTFARECEADSSSGAEFMVGIPGTIGGGIRMNAGAYGREFKDLVEYIVAIDRNGTEHKIHNSDIGFKYRGNGLPKDFIFVSTILYTEHSNGLVIQQRMHDIMLKRSETQPVKERTGGSTFANPDGNSAWKLIDSAGMRGYCIGDAEMSTMHCNFMINKGNATASDLITLGETVRQRVLESSGVNLKWEIEHI